MRFGVNFGGSHRAKEGDLPELSLSAVDILLHLLAFAVTVGIIVYTAVSYGQLPEYVPLHFGVNGEADSWGARHTVLFMPALAVFCYALIAISSFFPKAFNMPVEITAENAPRLYRATRTGLLLINLQASLIFACVVAMVIRTAMELPVKMFNYGLWALMALLLITTFVMISYCFKQK